MPTPNVFVTYHQLRERGVPYTRVHLNRMMTSGDFPPARQLSPGRIAWVLADIENWIATRPIARRFEARSDAVD